MIFTDVPFPKSYVPLCRKILTRLFRVFVHVYIHHFDRIVAIGAVNTLQIFSFEAFFCFLTSIFSTFGYDYT